MKKFLFFVLLICVFGLSFAASTVVVASKIDTEGALLGNMIYLMLERNGIPAENRTEFGTTSVVRAAIKAGEIDIYPDYTGNGGFFFEGIDPSIWKNARKGYEKVKELDYEANNIVWLTPAKANNTWAIAIRKVVADMYNIVSLQDFADHINDGGYIKIACSEEFVTRPDSLPAFEKAYGFKLKNEQILTFAGGNTAQTERAAAIGTDGVNTAMAYGTDGALPALGLVVLEDTLGVQPVYEPAPLVRENILTEYPQIEELLKPVFESLDLVTLQTLNSRIALEGRAAIDVAEAYLLENGFIK